MADEKRFSIENERTAKDEFREGFPDDAEAVSPPTADELEFLRKEKKVVRKLDLYIAPVMFLLQLISYLDRGNIGFAATQGMVEDINLRGADLNVSQIYCRPFKTHANAHQIAVSIFYITYILAEVRLRSLDIPCSYLHTLASFQHRCMSKDYSSTVSYLPLRSSGESAVYAWASSTTQPHSSPSACS